MPSLLVRSLCSLVLGAALVSCGGSPKGAGGAGTGGAGGADTGGEGGGGGTGGVAPGGSGGGGAGGSAPDSGPAAADTGAPMDEPDAGLPVDSALPADTAEVADGGSRHGRAAIVWGYGEHSPTPKPTDPPKAFDLTMKARLEAKGLKVDMLEDAVSKVEDVVGKVDLLVISSSINRDNLFDATKKARFKDVPVPTIVMKDGTIEVMGLGAGSAGGFSTEVGQTQLTIIAPGDPLAAGLTGNVTVYSKGDRLIWASPGPAAKKIATIVGKPAQIGIFAYPAGATMVGGAVAPAKRMGFFIHRNTNYSPDGIKLFDAAVDYLLAP
jgi:hypothetical protein